MTLDDVIASAQPAIVPVQVSGRTFYVRALSGAGRGEYLKFVREKDLFSIGGVVLFGLCDERGTLLGDPFSAEDRAKMDRADGETLQRIADAFMEISGLTDRAAKEAEKKSDPSPSESSGTD